MSARSNSETDSSVRPLILKDPALLVESRNEIWIEGEGLRREFIGPLKVAFRVAGRAKHCRHEELPPKYRQGADIVGIDGERLFAQRNGGISRFADKSAFPKARAALESQVLGVAVGRRHPFETGGLGLGELKVECVRETRNDRVLRLQEIGASVSNCSAQR